MNWRGRGSWRPGPDGDTGNNLNPQLTKMNTQTEWRTRNRPTEHHNFTEQWMPLKYDENVAHQKRRAALNPALFELQYRDTGTWVDWQPEYGPAAQAAPTDAWQARTTGGRWQTVPTDMLQVWRDASAHAPERYQMRRMGSEPISGALLIEALVDVGLVFEEQPGDYRTIKCDDVSSKLTLAIELLGIAP